MLRTALSGSDPVIGPGGDTTVPTWTMTALAEPPAIEREFTVASRSQFQNALRRLRRNPLAMGGLVTFTLMLLAAFLGPLLFSYGFDQQSDTLSAPPGTDGHLFGTDTLGRDVLLLTLRGIQWSMLMCVVFVVVAGAVGVLVGALAGYAGGKVDEVLMSGVDIVLTLPFLAVVIVVAAAFPSARTPVGVALLIALFSWTTLARIVRVEFLSLREREFVEAAHAVGASSRRIVFRHLIPNSISQITVWCTLGATGAIGAEAALSFLGYGVQGDEVSLGRLVAEGAAAAGDRPWLFYFPGLTLLLIVLSVSMIGDGIQDAFDPKAARVR
jgi:ABC-type dipeptide/oligopeptide/nickel transport system permease subunit